VDRCVLQWDREAHAGLSRCCMSLKRRAYVNRASSRSVSAVELLPAMKETTLHFVAQIMVVNRIRYCVVLNNNREVVGLISSEHH